MLVSEEISFNHMGPWGWSKDESFLGWAKSRSKMVVYHPGQCSRRFYWYG